MSDLSGTGATPAATPAAPAEVAPPAGEVAPAPAPTVEAPASPAAAPPEPPATPEAPAVDPFLESFSGYDDATKESWAKLAKLMSDDPVAGAAELKRIADNILADDDDEPNTPEAPVTNEVPKTKEELEAFLAQRDAEQQRQRDEAAAVESGFKDPETLTGFTRGTREMREFLMRAHEEHNGDLDAAYAAVQAERQAVIDAYVAEQAGRNSGFAPLPGTGGDAVNDPTGGAPKDFKAAKNSLLQRISQRA